MQTQIKVDSVSLDKFSAEGSAEPMSPLLGVSSSLWEDEDDGSCCRRGRLGGFGGAPDAWKPMDEPAAIETLLQDRSTNEGSSTEAECHKAVSLGDHASEPKTCESED